MRQKNDTAKIVTFLVEAGMLKRMRRSGWEIAGIGNPESVAEHCFRCAVIGYCLAKMEGAKTYPVVMMALFNDIHEARIGDFHKLAQRYIDITDAEDRAHTEQCKFLIPEIADELNTLRKHYRAQKTRESIIARDADIPECLLQAKEYFESGYSQAEKFFKKAPRHLKTRSAKKLWQHARTAPINDWWLTLTRFER